MRSISSRVILSAWHILSLSFGSSTFRSPTRGRYAFTLPDTVARGELRPLRDPRTAGIDDV